MRPLDLSNWLIVDGSLEADRSEKADLLQHRRDDVVVSLPGSESAAAEAYRQVVAHLSARDVAVPPDPGSVHPIEAAARLVQEDLVLLELDAGVWRLTSACVCFPTRWGLAEKSGQSMSEIHRPVPRYGVDLEARVETFFDRLRVGRPVWRTNWSIDDDFSLRLEPGASAVADPTITAANVADRLCLRIEYQTLRRLPESDAILFTIRILRHPLRWVIENGEASGLRLALDALPLEVAAYKSGTVRYREQISRWLAAEAPAGP